MKKREETLKNKITLLKQVAEKCTFTIVNGSLKKEHLPFWKQAIYLEKIKLWGILMTF